MQYSAASVLAFVAAAVAQLSTSPDPNPAFNPISSPSTHQVVAPGSELKIQWTAAPEFADVKVTIELIGGPEQNKQTFITTVGTDITNSANEYDWTIPTSIGGLPWYGLKIISQSDNTDWQYSNPFNITAGEGAPTTTAATTTITTASGTAIITLSVASVTSSAAVSTSAVESSSSAIESSSSVVHINTTTLTTVAAPPTIPTSSIEIISETSSAFAGPESSAPAVVPESGAETAKVGIFALVGGIAAALML